MILRHSHRAHAASCALLLTLAAAGVAADDLFDCHATVGELKYDLTSLAGQHTLTREGNTPPTKWKESLTFNLCEALPKNNLPEGDQVSSTLSSMFHAYQL